MIPNTIFLALNLGQRASFRQEQRVRVFEHKIPFAKAPQFARVTRVLQLVLAVVPNVRRIT